MVAVLWFAVRHLGAVALLGLLATALGWRLSRGLRFGGPAEAAALRATVGLLALGTGGLVLGLAGRLTPGSALLLFGAAAAWSWREARELLGAFLSAVRDLAGFGWRRQWPAVAAFALVVVPMAVLALYPPTGYDALNYHLPYVRAFVEQGALVPVDTLRFPVFPQLNEVLFTLVALVVDDVAAQSVQLLPALLVAALVASWAGRMGGASSGAWAAGLWLGNPLVVWMSGQAYIDLGLTLFVVAAFVCLERFRTDRAPGFLALGGALLGAACGVKYLGLLALPLGVAHAWGTAPTGRRWRHAAVVLAAAGAIAAPWYARIAWETGNPVFPYLREVFARSDWWYHELAQTHDDRAQGLGGRLWKMARRAPVWLLSLPVAVTWARETFDRQAPHTPWTVLLVAVTAWRAWRDRRLAWLLLGCVTYVVLLLYTARQDLRFFFPVAAALAAGGAVAVRPLVAMLLRAGRRAMAGPARRILSARRALSVVLLLVCLGPGMLYGVYKLRERGTLPVDAASRETFLARWVPGYRAVSFLDAHRPGATVYGLPFEPVRYYARGRYVGDKHGRYSYRLVLDRWSEPGELHSLLRSWGVDHLLLGARYAQRLPAGQVCFEPVYQDDESSLFRLADGPCGATTRPVVTNGGTQPR